MSLPRYREYKVSGIDWLPKIPAHWDVCALKRLASLQSGESITAEKIEDAGEYPVYGGNGLRGFTAAFTHEGRFALIGRQGALCGNVNYSQGKFWASEHAVVVTPLKPVNTTWLGEMLRAMNLNQYSVSAAQPGLSVELISRIAVPYPPLDEQAAIASFLERETAKIDMLIAEQEKLITLLTDKRQATIAYAVTRGLNPNAPMRDSGVTWLGKIPAHWTLPPLYMRYSSELGKMLDASRITGRHLVPYLRNVDVQWDAINYAELPTMDIEASEYERYTVRDGDLLVCEGGEVGRAAVVQTAGEVIGFQKALHRLRALSCEEYPRYMFYIFAWASKAGAFAGEGQSTIAHLTGEQLRKYRFPRPPLSEQQSIAGFLDGELVKLTRLTAAAERAIYLLKERRSVLISAATTGQIDVRSAVAQWTLSAEAIAA